MPSSSICRSQAFRRRGATVVLVAVMMTVMVGFAALTVDVGLMYNARADLQRAADAAALAATGVLRDTPETDNPLAAARAAAQSYVQSNRVIGRLVTVDLATDVVFGVATYHEATNSFDFSPTETAPNAVRVTVRMTEGSPNGPLPLVFARVWGRTQADVSATAVAAIAALPRDIVLSIDLSSSMNNDSQLYKVFDGVQVNTRDVWAALDGPPPSFPYLPGAEHETEYAFDQGPAVGVMTDWGSPLDPGFYDPATDDGLWYLPYDQPITESAALASLVERGYSADEIAVLAAGGDWEQRILVVLGLAQWASGKTGAPYPGGDGDDRIEAGELTVVDYPGFRKTWTWGGYRDYVSFTLDGPFRYRYGPKTFTEYLLDKQYRNARTDLFQTPAQPLQALKDGVQILANRASNQDRMSLIAFAFGTSAESDLTEDLQSVASRLYDLQPGHFGSGTNIGGGLQVAIDQVLSGDMRDGARRFIVLMSDGRSNTGPSALDEAQRAADEDITVFTVSVGEEADRALMQQISAMTGGREYYAFGQPDEYAAQLRAIFKIMSNAGGITLIE